MCKNKKKVEYLWGLFYEINIYDFNFLFINMKGYYVLVRYLCYVILFMFNKIGVGNIVYV